MIARLASFLIVLWALGFALFAVTLGKPAPDDAPATEAIVALTGGKGRIEHAARLLADGKGKRLLISGADPSVRKEDLMRRLGGKPHLAACCVDLGSESVDTRSNAEEARRWLDRRGFDSVRWSPATGTCAAPATSSARRWATTIRSCRTRSAPSLG